MKPVRRIRPLLLLSLLFGAISFAGSLPAHADILVLHDGRQIEATGVLVIEDVVRFRKGGEAHTVAESSVDWEATRKAKAERSELEGAGRYGVEQLRGLAAQAYRREAERKAARKENPDSPPARGLSGEADQVPEAPRTVTVPKTESTTPGSNSGASPPEVLAARSKEKGKPKETGMALSKIARQAGRFTATIVGIVGLAAFLLWVVDKGIGRSRSRVEAVEDPVGPKAQEEAHSNSSRTSEENIRSLADRWGEMHQSDRDEAWRQLSDGGRKSLRRALEPVPQAPRSNQAVVARKKTSGCAWGCLVLFLAPLVLTVLLGDADSPSKAPSAPKTPQEVRKELVEQHFSSWDGSHVELTKIIKLSMNDPDSYDHVSTRYIDKGNYLIVTTEFRGRNAFGGVVKNAVVAKVDLDGSVLKIISD